MKLEILPKMLISSILSHIMTLMHSYATKIYPESEFLTENEKTFKNNSYRDWQGCDGTITYQNIIIWFQRQKKCAKIQIASILKNYFGNFDKK